MLIRIVSPYFVAGIDYPKRYAPILNWMRKRKWARSDIKKYCASKGWKFQIINNE
jgi:hypothetical protein